MAEYKNMEFSLKKMKKILGIISGKRVSRDAAIELDKDLRDHGREITGEAILIAEEDNRKTVRGSDIREAVEKLQ